jgi:hypothetical protein
MAGDGWGWVGFWGKTWETCGKNMKNDVNVLSFPGLPEAYGSLYT